VPLLLLPLLLLLLLHLLLHHTLVCLCLCLQAPTFPTHCGVLSIMAANQVRNAGLPYLSQQQQQQKRAHMKDFLKVKALHYTNQCRRKSSCTMSCMYQLHTS
jgi:hypothetical protein